MYVVVRMEGLRTDEIGKDIINQVVLHHSLPLCRTNISIFQQNGKIGKSFSIQGNNALGKAPYLRVRKTTVIMKTLLAFALILTTSCSARNTETPEINQNTTLPMNQTTITLNNGVVIPQFGLGVYSIPAGETTYNSVLAALKAGYRHIDTAHAYQNERSVGQAVKDSGIPREEIWITSKPCVPSPTAGRL